MPPSKVLQVFIFKGSEFLGTDVFDKARVLVGRDSDSADLVLESTHVSRRHAVIDVEGDRVFIQDAGSKNGIYVNDEPVQRTEVTRLDKITVGNFTLKIKLVASGEVEEARSRGRQSTHDVPLGSTVDAAFVRGVTPPPLSSLINVHQGTSQAPSGDARQRTSQTSGLLDGPPDAVTQDIEIFKEQQRQAGRGHDLTPVLGSTSELAGQAGRSETGESARRGHGRTQDAVQLRTHDAVQLRTQDAMRLRTHEFEGQAPRAEPTQAEVSNPAWHTTSIRAEGYQDAYRSEAHEHGQHDDDHDDHDDEDEHFEAPYSLAKRVLSDAGGTNAGPQTCIELMAVVSDKVTDFALLRPGSVTWSRASKGAAIPGLKSLKHQRDGNCLVVCDEAVTGSLKRAGQNLELHHFFQSQGPQGCRGLLKRGELLNIQGGRTSYFIRHVNPPPVPPDDRSLMEKLGLDGAIFNVAIASFLAHALIGIAITALTPEEQPPPKSEEFVVAVKQEPQLEEPKPEPPKPPEPPAPPTPPAPPQKTKPDRAPRPRRMAKPSPVRAQAPVPAPPGILGLLSKKGSTQAPGPAAAVAAVSNLSAVKVPGNQGSFRVSGLIGKLPSSSGISVGGGGGALVTKGANALLRGGGGGAGKLAGIGPRQVGGMVQKVPRGMHMGGGGSLDRASIERVVNQHADEIQRCYERELLKDSSLAGKVQVEWIIDTGGNVPSVRQVFSSAKSVGVVRCIMDSIKTWKFPKPQGGSVVVDFPFILKGMDF